MTIDNRLSMPERRTDTLVNCSHISFAHTHTHIDVITDVIAQIR